MLWIVCMALLVQSVVGQRFVQIANNNEGPIWIETLPNDGKPPLDNGAIHKIDSGSQKKYDIPTEGWAGRFWPKVGCDDDGKNCEFGQSMAPCPDGGCQPPADTKMEFNFPPEGSQDTAWYDISLVDGYSLASEIVPQKDGQPYEDQSCVSTDCHMTLDDCPKDEQSGLGDLSAKGRSGNTVACLSPCKKWTAPKPYGLARSEQDGNGKTMCCPEGVSPEDCRAGPVVNTKYVTLVRDKCPSAYSFSYDDKAGLHNCPSGISYNMSFS